MEINIFNDINPVIQKQLHEHYKMWYANKIKSSGTRGGIRIKGFFKCNNCKKYFPEDDTVVIQHPSGKTTRRCLLCDLTIKSEGRIRRRK